MTRDIFLVHKDPGLLAHFKEKLGKNGTSVNSVSSEEELPGKADSPHHPVVVIDLEDGWNKVIETLEALKKNEAPFYAVISTTPLLERTSSQIDSVSEQLASDASVPLQNRRKTDHQNGEPNFAELLEKRLACFIKKIRASEGKNLYDLLIQEVEKPLIKLALEETGGNQVQASQLLGLHRNTLRRKMRELDIPSAKKYSR